MKHGKKYVDAAKNVDRTKNYDVNEALQLVVDNAKANFDETIEAHIRLGVDSRHADQQVRGAVVSRTVPVRRSVLLFSPKATRQRLQKRPVLTLSALRNSQSASRRRTSWTSTSLSLPRT